MNPISFADWMRANSENTYRETEIRRYQEALRDADTRLGITLPKRLSEITSLAELETAVSKMKSFPHFDLIDRKSGRDLSEAIRAYTAYLAERESIPSVRARLDGVKSYIAERGFCYEQGMIENLYLCLKAKPLLLLTGIRGSGKTRLVRLFAEAIGASCRMVSVRPDWSDPSDLLGYTDLNRKFIAGPIFSFIRQASLDPIRPYILCLDEMNLARAEYYMSEILSVMETRRVENGEMLVDPIVRETLYGADEEALGAYGTFPLPANLSIVGTVNTDETTFPISGMVLDRANTAELSCVDLLSMPPFSAPCTSPQSVGDDFLKSRYAVLNDCASEDREYIAQICAKLQRINELLSFHPARIGYRVRDEIVFYLLENRRTELLEESAAFDFQILQRILPKLQGNGESVRASLEALMKFCEGERYERSIRKLRLMMKRYDEDGFTSYWQ